MGVGLSCRVVAVVAVAVGLVVAAPATAPATPGGATMFVHSAKGGELRAGRLILRGVGRKLTWVTNGGRSGLVSVTRLHRGLFSEGTPAATGVLHIAGTRPGRMVGLRLSRPSYRASRHRVSYRARPLNERRRSARAPVPRRFGAASLSILGAPEVLGGTSGGHTCSALLVNHTAHDLRLVSATKSKTDNWTRELAAGTTVAALSGFADWESDGGPLLGCSNTTVWEFRPDPAQPSLPSATFTVTTAYPWTGPFSNTCTSSNPLYRCRSATDQPGQATWGIQPN